MKRKEKLRLKVGQESLSKVNPRKITKNLSVLPKKYRESQKVATEDELGVQKSHSVAPKLKRGASKKNVKTFVTENEDRDDDSIIDQE